MMVRTATTSLGSFYLRDGPLIRRAPRAGYPDIRGTGVAAGVPDWPRAGLDRKLHLQASFPSAIVREGQAVWKLTRSFFSPPGSGSSVPGRRRRW
jgi:hypothetical protein